VTFPKIWLLYHKIHQIFIFAMRIFLIGYMGCGKTTVGKRLANKLGLRFLDLDSYVEGKYGKTVAEQFEEVGEVGFRERERNAVNDICAQFDNILVSTGGGAPCFFDNLEKMNAAGVTIYLKMTAMALASRLKGARRSRPLLRDKTEEELVAYIEKTLGEREVYYNQAHIVVSALSIDVDGLVNRIYHALNPR
jgi:shikimate kinase